MDAFWIVLIVIAALFVLDMLCTSMYCFVRKVREEGRPDDFDYGVTYEGELVIDVPDQNCPGNDKEVPDSFRAKLEEKYGTEAAAKALESAEAIAEGKSKGSKFAASTTTTAAPAAPKKQKVSFKSKLRAAIDGFILYQCNTLQYLPSQTLRKFMLKYVYHMNLSWKAIIYHGTEFRDPWNISIEEGASIGDHCVLDGRKGLSIGPNVNIGSRALIWTEQHDYNDPDFKCNDKGGLVCIGERAWVSSGAIVLPKVTIEKGAVLAAGAVATKDLYQYTVYGGVPAKKIGVRNPNLNYSLKDTYLHFY